MQWQCSEPQRGRPGVTVLEAAPGPARDEVVARWLGRHPSGDGAWRVRCDAREGGPWSGLDALLEALVPRLREHAPELLTQHAHELRLVVPSLTSDLDFPKSLTDTVDGDEKTRNYPADRAYRSLHGLIELLAEWHERSGDGPWSIACDGFDDAGGMVRRFFVELARRRGAELGLRLLAVVGEGAGAAAADELGASSGIRLDLAGPDARRPAPATMARVATELERRVADDPGCAAALLPRLIEAWGGAEAPLRALPWQIAAMECYNHAGLYEASLPYAKAVRVQLERIAVEDPDLYHRAVNALYFCLVPLGEADAARVTMERLLERVSSTADVARYCYLLAMLHARFLEPTDQDTAEAYLQRALGVLVGPDIAEEQRHFLTVFTMNGLALVRLRQRRIEEALELCRDGFARLDEHLRPDSHRLHRSVLLFNIAQVHAQIGPYEVAVDYFTQAMEMDPNYSEYYNDRGGVYLKMGRFEDAERDFLRAIELSPPYAEVWTNLGQCLRATGRMGESVHAYSRSLDLDPDSALALVGRADAQLELDRPELALADYDRSLKLEPDQALVLASRAIVHYGAGRVADAVADLDAAVALAPDVAELYWNRATALRDLGREAEAEADLTTYLELSPDAEDRAEVEAALTGAGR